jgi:CHAD domain-containing protein
VSGPRRAARSSQIEASLAPDMRADAAAVAVLRRLLEVIGDNLDGSVAGIDDEHLHQLRIAVRRTRTVQRQFAGVFPARQLPGFRSDFRWLQRTTGEARDLDVHVADLEGLAGLLEPELRADLRPLRPVLLHGRLTARATMSRAIASERTQTLFADWERLLETLVELPTHDRPDARRPVGELVAHRVARLYRRIVKMGRAIGPASPAQEYHELRKQGKELRYLLELFGLPLFGDDAVGELVRALKALQEVLGRHQDREVQQTLLREVAEEIAGMPRGGAACLAMGVLIDRLSVDEHIARREFVEHFERFSGKALRKLVRGTSCWR